jgi:ricin-type beta-trefoil lectin protein
MTPVVYARFFHPGRGLLILVCAAMLAAMCTPGHVEAAKKPASIDNAQWFAIVSRANQYQSVEVASRECQRQEGLEIRDWYYESRANQQWRFVSQPNGTYAIVVRHTRQAMTVVTAADGHAELRAMRRSNAVNQQWIVKRIRSYYVIHPAGAPHRSLSVPAKKIELHLEPLEVSDGSAATGQQWLLVPSYTIGDAPPLPCRPPPGR